MRFRFDPHIAFRVASHTQAVDFYRRVFGMELVSESAEEVVLGLGDTRFYVERSEEDDPEARAGPVPTSTWLAFTVDDLSAARQVLEQEGCRVQEHRDGDEVGLLVVDPYGMKCFVSESAEGGADSARSG